MTTIKETRDHIVLLIDPHTDHLTDLTFITDIDHAHILEIKAILQEIYLLLDHLRTPRESRFFRPCSHSNTRNKLNTIQPQTQNDPINFEVYV